MDNPSNTPSLGLLQESSGIGVPSTTLQGPAPITQEILCEGEGSESMDEAGCMRDPLLVQDLHAPVQSAGNGSGTKGAAICGGPGELYKQAHTVK